MSARTTPTPQTNTPRGRIAARFARLALATALLAGVFAPQTALAWRAGFDEVGGKALSSGVPAAVAPDIDAAAGILVDADGRELWSRRGGERRAMASTTKMMTALLVLEHANLDAKVTVSPAASRVPYATGLVPGERRTVRELLRLMLVTSSNDAAYALGEHVGRGSMPAFVKLMNERARKLGLADTRFANPHGLDARGHFSTPADLADLAQAATEHEEYRRVTQMRKVLLPGTRGRAPRWLKSTDRLLGVYQGIVAGKTGYTRNAKYSFVAQATRGGVTLTAVILAAPTERGRFAQTARLFDWGFRNLKVRRLSSAGEAIADVPVNGSAAGKVPVRIAEDAQAAVFAPDGPVERKPWLAPNVKLPVFEGQPIGEVRLVQGERVLATVPAVAATSTVSVEQTVGAVPVAGFVNRKLTVRAGKVAPAKLPAFEPGSPVDQKIDLEPRISAPISAGERVGEITYSQGGRVVATVPVVAAEAVEAPTFVESLRTAFARSWRVLTGEPAEAKLELVGS